MEQRFFIFEAVLALLTMIASPIIGKIVEKIFGNIETWRVHKQQPPHVYSSINVEAVLKLIEQGSYEFERVWIETKVNWDRTEIHLDFCRNKINSHLWQRCHKLLHKANDYMGKANSTKDIRWVEAALDQITDIDAIINKEIKKIERIQDRSGTGYVLGLITAVAIAGGAIAFLTSPSSIFASALDWKLFNMIPLYIFVFSVIGGVGSALYTFKSSIFSQNPINDFIVAPTFSIITGVMLYLAIQAGLIVFGNAILDEANSPLFAVIAFIGGFFSEKTINIIDGISFRGS